MHTDLKIFIGLLSIICFLTPLFSFAQTTHQEITVRYKGYQQKPQPVVVNDLGFVSISDLQPTQTFIGKLEVKRKKKNLKRKSKINYKKYILEHPVPVVLRRDSNVISYYILDRHHLTRALLELGADSVLVEIKAVIAARSEDEFWNEMVKRNWVYPYDENHQLISNVAEFTSILPHHVENMKDDLYRSIAGAVRDRGGFFKDRNHYFIEFTWANFFREQIKIKPTKYGFKKALRKASQLARSPEASHLPGYIKSQNLTCTQLL